MHRSWHGAHNQYHFYTEYRCAVLKTGDDLRRNNISGDPRRKNVADALVENDFDRNARVRTRQHGGKRFLLFGRLLLENCQILGVRAQIFGNETSVSLPQLR